MLKSIIISAALLLFCTTLFAQSENFGGFKQVYPIADDPSIGFMSSYIKSEPILFEANPIVRFSIYNNIVKKLNDGKNRAQAYYIAAKPQWRMYTENSLPVKMPSFKVLIGTQQVFRCHDSNLLILSLESGHYSNGQSGCAFSEKYDDASPQCDSIYATINDKTNLTAILNRKNGNFSTDITEIYGNYRFNKLDANYIPCRTHSILAGLTIYHDNFLGLLPFGGYSDADIKIYGRLRFHVGYEYIHTLKKKCLFLKDGARYSLLEKCEIIQGAHPSVNPFRSVTTASLFPFSGSKEFGFFASFITGHDNYNYRFVDSGVMGVVGISFISFPPFTIKK